MNETTGGILDIIGLWRNGYIKEATDVLDAWKTKDIVAIADELGDLFELFGFKGMDKEITELATAIKSGRFWYILHEACDPVKLVAAKYMEDETSIKTMASSDKMPRADAQAWLVSHREELKRAAKDRRGKFMLRRSPDFQKLLAGEMLPSEVAGMSDETKEKIVNVLRVMATICTTPAPEPSEEKPKTGVASIIWPPALLIAQALRLIIAFYDSRHPTTGLADVGLSLEDFA